jgi:hypothetical protein
MNKYLMMSAAAALAVSAAGEADAGTSSVHFASSGGASFCDGLILHHSGHIYVGEHLFSHCYSGAANLPVLGLGELWKQDPVGAKNVDLGDISIAYNYHEAYICTYDLTIPVKAGGKWAMWCSLNGDSAFLVNEGVLLAGKYAARQGVKPDSTAAKVAETLRARAKEGQ